MPDLPDILLDLPYGWWLGFPEFLRKLDMPEEAGHLEIMLGRRNEDSRIIFEDSVADVLDWFLNCKSCRSKLN